MLHYGSDRLTPEQQAGATEALRAYILGVGHASWVEWVRSMACLEDVPDAIRANVCNRLLFDVRAGLGNDVLLTAHIALIDVVLDALIWCFSKVPATSTAGSRGSGSRPWCSRRPRAQAGDTARARASFTSARSMLDEVSVRLPDSTDVASLLVATHVGLGHVAASTGDRELSLAHFRAAVRASEPSGSATHLTPENAPAALIGLGDALAEMGDPAAAAATYRRALEAAERLAAEEPHDLRRKADAARIRGRIGDACMAQGHCRRARCLRRVSRRPSGVPLSRDPANPSFQASTVVSQGRSRTLLRRRATAPEPSQP